MTKTVQSIFSPSHHLRPHSLKSKPGRYRLPTHNRERQIFVPPLSVDCDSIRQPNSSRTLRRMRGTARRDSPRNGNSHKGTHCLKAYVDSRRGSCAEVSPALVIHFDPFPAASGQESTSWCDLLCGVIR